MRADHSFCYSNTETHLHVKRGQNWLNHERLKQTVLEVKLSINMYYKQCTCRVLCRINSRFVTLKLHTRINCIYSHGPICTDVQSFKGGHSRFAIWDVPTIVTNINFNVVTKDLRIFLTNTYRKYFLLYSYIKN